MEQYSRRSFIKSTSVALAAAGAAAVLPIEAAGAATKSPAARLAPGDATLDETVIAHVRDLASGEIALYVGTREVVVRDREVAARLLAATHKGR